MNIAHQNHRTHIHHDFSRRDRDMDREGPRGRRTERRANEKNWY